jgi:FlgO protein
MVNILPLLYLKFYTKKNKIRMAQTDQQSTPKRYFMFKKATIFIPVLLLATLGLGGCAGSRFFETRDADLIEVSSDVADELREKATRSIPKNSLILVSTLLNVNDLQETSAFGRIISDQIASAFHNSGYRIIGMEMPIDLFVMKEGGVWHLSDEIKALLKPYNAAVIVGGVYAPGKRNTYVSLRIIDLFTKNIISSTDVAVPMGPDARKLLISDKLSPNVTTPPVVPVGAAEEKPLAEDSVPAEDPAKKTEETTVEEYQR